MRQHRALSLEGAHEGPGMGPQHGPFPGAHPGHEFGHHKGRGPGRHGRGGRRRRVTRGEVRNAVLTLLAEEPMHGYQVMQEMEERSGGGWQPSPGSVYPTLQLLADEGLVESEAEGGKNIFSLTDAGRAAVEQIEGPPVWEGFTGDGMANLVNLRRSMFQLGAAVKQVSAAGSEAHISAAQTVLNDARKALYRILASDEETEQ